MPEYKAPLRDMQFLNDEVFDFHAGYAAMGASDATPDMVSAMGCTSVYVLQRQAKTLRHGLLVKSPPHNSLAGRGT